MSPSYLNKQFHDIDIELFVQASPAISDYADRLEKAAAPVNLHVNYIRFILCQFDVNYKDKQLIVS